MTDDWTRRAEREAAAILNGTGFVEVRPATYPTLVSLLAVAWLQGVNYGSHETLRHAEDAFAALKASL
jgi:hypothetical protein